MPFLTRTTATRTGIPSSDVEELRAAYNALCDTISMMMPGVLTSAAASKTGTTSAATWRTEVFSFRFRGLKVTTSAQEKAFTATTHDVAASKQAWFALSVQSNGTSFTITKGADQTIGTDVLPTGPDNEIIVGYLKIVTGAGGIWDASTDDLAVGAGAGPVVSVTFNDNPPVLKVGLKAGADVSHD